MQPTSSPKTTLLIALLYCIFLLSGCGYTNPYNTNNKLAKDGEGQVDLYLDMWENKTNLLGFQATIQHDLIIWLKKSNRFHLTQNRDESDYILSGIIQSVNQPALTYGAFERATTLRAEVNFSYKLIDRETGKVVFTQERIAKETTYSMGSDAVRTNSNLKKALGVMSEDLADNIYIQLFYLFTLDTSQGNRIIIPTDDIEGLE
ncbi:MAG: LPS assembly lipoprotein LptE [Desulfobulbaceae bacterium]|jgi:ABC-type uncharacterized transport system auxiliary subunit|nr:LPS assembly lipoprotein LptE [Desulfobulbaceae bacterium]